MLRYAILAALAILTASPRVEAGLFRYRCRGKVVMRWHGCASMPVATPACPSPQATPQAPAAVQSIPGPVGYADGPAAALAAVNAIRSLHGRGPLTWDATLAGFAASNNAMHAPGSSGGGSQAWAGVWSYTQAVQMWAASPPHLAILLGAVGSVGISTCPTGCTLNAR